MQQALETQFVDHVSASYVAQEPLLVLHAGVHQQALVLHVLLVNMLSQLIQQGAPRVQQGHITGPLVEIVLQCVLHVQQEHTQEQEQERAHYVQREHTQELLEQGGVHHVLLEHTLQLLVLLILLCVSHVGLGHIQMLQHKYVYLAL